MDSTQLADRLDPSDIRRYAQTRQGLWWQVPLATFGVYFGLVRGLPLLKRVFTLRNPLQPTKKTSPSLRVQQEWLLKVGAASAAGVVGFLSGVWGTRTEERRQLFKYEALLADYVDYCEQKRGDQRPV